jgi:hypothetical protein
MGDVKIMSERTPVEGLEELTIARKIAELSPENVAALQGFLDGIGAAEA